MRRASTAKAPIQAPEAPREPEAHPPSEGALDSETPSEPMPQVGANLRRLRTKRGLSLERLARISGVSRAMLSQIELGQSAPTINLLWRIARALELPFGALLNSESEDGVHLLPASNAKRLTSQDGTFSTRALFPFDAPRRCEFYELRLSGGAIERASAHAPGTTENLVVSVGRLEVGFGGSTYLLEEGDALMFAADQAHSYHNPDVDEAVLYLVMTYAAVVGN